MQLLAILDAAVQAASSGTHVPAILEVRRSLQHQPLRITFPLEACILACKGGYQHSPITYIVYEAGWNEAMNN